MSTGWYPYDRHVPGDGDDLRTDWPKGEPEEVREAYDRVRRGEVPVMRNDPGHDNDGDDDGSHDGWHGDGC